MQVKILGAHNCESRDTRMSSLLVDGILALDASALSVSLSFAEQQELRGILLTHHHYDHLRDIPALAMNALLFEMTLNLYGTSAAYGALAAYLLNGELYPRFLTEPEAKPVLNFTVIEPGWRGQIAGYPLQAVAMNHSVATVGYEVTSPDGRSMFYTGDTGPGLEECWRSVSPHLLVIEVTVPNRYEEFARQSGHFAPGLLEAELRAFRGIKGYLPQVVAVHMNPRLEPEIAAEVDAVAKALGSSIVLGHEGMLVQV